MGELLPTTLEKKKNEALHQLEENFRRLENKVDDHKIRSESFHVTLVRVLRLITTEKSNEKRDAFRAIILNEVISPTENSELDYFLHVTENLTADHIRMLKIFSDPIGAVKTIPGLAKQFEDLQFGGINILLHPFFPSITRDHFAPLADDLNQKGLTTVARTSFGTTMSGHGILQKKTSPLGDRYIQFISLPLNLG